MSAARATERLIADESELISRILSGERNLYYDLIAPYEHMVYICAFSVLRNETDAEDVAQDAFLKAYENLAEFKGESKFSSWLTRIALNTAKLRRRKFRPELYQSLHQSISEEDGEYIPQSLGDWREIPSETLERQEVRALLADAVRRLPDIYRDVFVLRDVQNLNIAATAEILGVSEGVVKTRLLRARLHLRDWLMPLLKSSRVFSRQAFKRGTNPWL